MINRRRTRILLYLVTAIIAVATLFLYCTSSTLWPSIENISQVSIGMSQSEVALLFGEPVCKVGPSEVSFGGDSDNPVGSAIGFSLFGTDNRGYWEYQMNETGSADSGFRVEKKGFEAAIVGAMFGSPDKNSIVIYFGSDGTVDEIKVPNPIDKPVRDLTEN